MMRHKEKEKEMEREKTGYNQQRVESGWRRCLRRDE